MTTDPAIDSLTFDEALAQLQGSVAELEAGGQALEAAIALYERGVALQARCEKLLGDAELRVQQLVARAGGALETRDVTRGCDGRLARDVDRLVSALSSDPWRRAAETRDLQGTGLQSGGVDPARAGLRTTIVRPSCRAT